MSKEKLVRLTKYTSELKNRLSAPIPTKHQNRPVEYKQFLERELHSTNTKMESLKLVLSDKK